MGSFVSCELPKIPRGSVALLLKKTVIEFNACICSVAKRLALGRPATAERLAVPFFVPFAVVRFNRDSASISPCRLWLSQKRSSPKRLNNVSKKREDLRNKTNGVKTFVSGQLARVEHVKRFG